MPFKGNIPKGSRVEAELSVTNAAQGSALVAMSFADNGGGAGADSCVVAPGGACRCSVQTNPQPTGMLRVVVDFKRNDDTGRLTVRVNGQVHDEVDIEGDTTWSYSLA